MDDNRTTDAAAAAPPGPAGTAGLPSVSTASPALPRLIDAAIDAAGGRLPFDRYMALALYAPGLGYYARSSRQFGTMPDSGSDFVTAPEMSSLFARALAAQVAQALAATGTDEIIEVGAGSGVLAAQLLGALDRLGVPVARYSIVEVSAALAARQRERLAPWSSRVRWLDALPEAIRGVVVGNEVLDAMPVKLLHWDGGRWLERCVARAATFSRSSDAAAGGPDAAGTSDVAGVLNAAGARDAAGAPDAAGAVGTDGAPDAAAVPDAVAALDAAAVPNAAGASAAAASREAPASRYAWADVPTPLRPPVDAPHEAHFIAGTTTELPLQATAFVSTLAERLARGAAFLIDYGFPAHEFYLPERTGGTLMCHRAHRADTDPLADPGEKDITAHVDFTAVALAAQDAGCEVLGYTSQGRFLINCGLPALMLGADWPTRTAAHKLVAEHEMGELFKVIGFARGAAFDALGFTAGDRSHTL